MRIQHNIMAMNSYRNYNNNVNSLSSNLEKLSSGYRINRAGDDAAGLAISEKMRAQITGLDAAQKNVKDGISLVKTAEGALQEVQDMMNRMVYLATQSANGTYDNEIDRANLQAEVDSLLEEIDRIADSANFNGQELLDGSLGGPKVEVVNLGAEKVTAATTGGGTQTVTAAKVAEVTLDFANKTADSLMGGTIEVDGTTYEFMDATAAAAYTGANTVVTLSADMTDAEIAAAFQGQFKTGTEFTQAATVNNTVVTLKGAADGSTGQTEDAVAVEMGDMGLKLQIGDSSDSFNQLMVSVQDMHADALGIGSLKIDTLADAQAAIDKIKTAINTVSSQRGDLGAIQNRLEHTMNNLSVMEENITDAESTIRDTDVADEMMAYTKNNILIQSAQAMLAQANAVPQGVLQLLQ